MIWHEYNKYSENQPKNENIYDCSEIPCLVRMSDGKLWIAYWVFDETTYQFRDYTGWVFKSFIGDSYHFDDDHFDDENKDDKELKVVAFAYLKDIM